MLNVMASIDASARLVGRVTTAKWENVRVIPAKVKEVSALWVLLTKWFAFAKLEGVENSVRTVSK